jgi:type I restriction enzyme S subunit
MSEYPPDWETANLKDIAEIKASNIDKKTLEGERSVRICNYTDVISNRLITKGIPFLRSSAAAAQVKTFTLLRNDILITKDAEVGKVSIVKDDIEGLVCGYHLYQLRTASKDVLPEYLFWALQGEWAQSHFRKEKTGTTIAGISRPALEVLNIPLPPLHEQKKIAEILSGINRSIVSLRLKKEKVQLVKSATSLKIFGSPECADQSVAQESSLQSLASIPISYGVLVPDNASKNNGVPMIKIQDIRQGKIQTEKLSYISQRLHQKYAKTEVRTGDLLISLIGSIGITARVPDALEGANVSRQFAVIRTSSSRMSDYLHCFLSGADAQEKIAFLSQGNAQKALNLDSLRELRVPLRSNEEMDKVVHVSRSLAMTIESISKRLNKAEKIRDSMASDLLSGRKRVSV